MKKIVNDLISDLAGAVSENWSDARQIQLAELVQRICRRGSEQARRHFAFCGKCQHFNQHGCSKGIKGECTKWEAIKE